MKQSPLKLSEPVEFVPLQSGKVNEVDNLMNRLRSDMAKTFATSKESLDKGDRPKKASGYSVTLK